MFKIKQFPRQALAEISQTHDEKFSFCQEDGDTLTECCTPVKCRDFYQNLWMHRKYKSQVKIYGFTYDDAKNPNVDFEKFRMLFYLTDTKHMEIFQQQLPKLQKELEILKWEPLEFLPTDDPLVLYVRGDKRWMATPYTISMITLLLRVATYENKGDKLLDDLTITSQDHGYLKCKLSYDPTKNVRDAIRAWMKTPTMITEFEGVPISIIHNFGGVMNMFALVNSGNKVLINAQQELKESIANEMSKL